jgi:hypothetical protein
MSLAALSLLPQAILSLSSVFLAIVLLNPEFAVAICCGL